MDKWVYGFGDRTSSPAGMANYLGEKGANLAEMTSLELPVPPGFTITTEVCTHFYASGRTYPPDLEGQVGEALSGIERAMGARFGDPERPLLVSVRSGARASMPGMMDTVLNLGLNDETVQGLARQSGDERFAYDSYRRFLQMYGQVVLGIEHHHFEALIEDHKNETSAALDTDLAAEDWRQIVAGFKDVVETETGRPFPQDPQEQLWGAIGAVFGSWMNPRAETYRRLHNIPADWGTAVNVQAMVFGNMGEDCATGVAFTRNPSTGANEFYGEYLVNAQGEDVVAGIRTPQHLTIAGKVASGSELPAMEEVMPEIFAELLRVRHTLESHFRDMQDIEFTVERGKLWILQTRSGKRTPAAAVRIAISLAQEGLLSIDEAVGRVDPDSIKEFFQPIRDPAFTRPPLCRGLPASRGIATGQVAFSAQQAKKLAARGAAVILVQAETHPRDIEGMFAAKGIVSSRGGMSSHASTAARGLDRPCVTGAGDIRVDYQNDKFNVRNTVVHSGDIISIDGSSGEIFAGVIPTIPPILPEYLITYMRWAETVRRDRNRARSGSLLNRSRGVVWVCDVENSTRYLNDDGYADAVEQFLPRLYIIGNLIVRAAGGKFIKWTGDGFFAWFETELYRDIGRRAANVLITARQLAICLEATQLGIESSIKLRIRNGVTYEHDAILTRLSAISDEEVFDIIGRDVVLAFRLSGIPATFPSIVTQRELVERSRAFLPAVMSFRRLRLTPQEIDRYFKGQRDAATRIVASSKGRERKRPISKSNAVAVWSEEIPIVGQILSALY